MEPIVLVHGGAGQIKDDKKAKVLVEGVKKAAKIGYNVLRQKGSVLDAVEAAVKYMEDNENYNAGKGSVLTVEGEVEMDASIMLGADLSAGAVTVVKDIQNPISLARLVMEKTSHILLAGEGAKKFAVSQGVQILPEGSLVTERTKTALTKYLASQERKGDDHELGNFTLFRSTIKKTIFVGYFRHCGRSRYRFQWPISSSYFHRRQRRKTPGQIQRHLHNRKRYVRR